MAWRRIDLVFSEDRAVKQTLFIASWAVRHSVYQMCFYCSCLPTNLSWIEEVKYRLYIFRTSQKRIWEKVGSILTGVQPLSFQTGTIERTFIHFIRLRVCKALTNIHWHFLKCICFIDLLSHITDPLCVKTFVSASYCYDRFRNRDQITHIYRAVVCNNLLFTKSFFTTQHFLALISHLQVYLDKNWHTAYIITILKIRDRIQ
jgi:hypothetical protein